MNGGLFRTRGCRQPSFFFFFPFKSFILIFNYESKKTKCLLNEPAATYNKLTHPSQICGD